MVIAQAVLATPIVVALVHRPASLLWAEYSDLARIDGLSTLRSIGLMFSLGHGSILTAFLAAFGRAIAEVGAIIIVGGNIAGFTRTMTTAITLETSKGDLAILNEGDKRLFNQYGVMLVNPARHPDVKAREGQAFIDWLVSPEGQKTIADYKVGGEQLFFPNASD